jgi:hypothetical protein
MSDRWLTFGEAVEIVRKNLGGASTGRSEAVTNAARASGEVRFQNPDRPVLLMADDGIVGMDMRPGAQNKGGVTSDGKPITHRPVNTMYQISEGDLLDWLGRHHPEQRAPGRRGRPSHDWSKISAAAFGLMNHHGEFSNDDPKWNAQARLEEALSDQFSVGISTLREHLPKLLDDWRKAKAGK